jgi:hypothetical protein
MAKTPDVADEKFDLEKLHCLAAHFVHRICNATLSIGLLICLLNWGHGRQ